jgi:hypothetical protein
LTDRVDVVEDSWMTRELPVLIALVEQFDDPAVSLIRTPQVAALTGLDESVVERGLTALFEARPRFVEGFAPEEVRVPSYISGVTERARRAVGAWPTPESVVDQLVQALTATAERERDPERESKLKEVAAWLAGGMRDVAVQVVGAVLTQHGL